MSEPFVIDLKVSDGYGREVTFTYSVAEVEALRSGIVLTTGRTAEDLGAVSAEVRVEGAEHRRLRERERRKREEELLDG